MAPQIVVDATPQKRIFLSIIADYDLKTSICELIDNALDHWLASEKSSPLKINVYLTQDRQIVAVKDNAGGVARDQIQLLIAPGASRENMTDEMIGNFGVGGKRAGVAIGELVEVYTRQKDSIGYKFVIDNDWLRKEDWDIEINETDDVEPSETRIVISKIRQGFDFQKINEIRSHLSQTYAGFLSNSCTIKLNGEILDVTKFDEWAYPKDYPPIMGTMEYSPDTKENISIRITGGLISDRSPSEDNYGVYFYCNKRLILAHEKSHHVGFLSGHAGVPHPDASLCRVIVEMNGPPSLMPWNSSKSGINWSHPVISEIREIIFSTATRYSKLSRRLKNERDSAVYPFREGVIEPFDFKGSKSGKEIVNLPLPRVRAKKYADRIIDANEAIFEKKPWVRGIVEAVGITDLVLSRRIQTKNRIALLLLDSSFEIALKEYIVHQKDKYYSNEDISKIFKSRKKVLDEIIVLAGIADNDADLALHYAELRNKLVHERATVDILDSDIETYRKVVNRIMVSLFDIQLTP